MAKQLLFLFGTLSLLLIPCRALFAQTAFHCAADEVRESRIQAHPEQRAHLDAIQQDYETYLAGPRSSTPLYVIPTVVHIIQNSPVIDVDDSLVYSQIEVLNEDFQRLNADSLNLPAVFHNIAADCRIEFRLASIDPNGCPSTGINRLVSPLTVHDFNDELALKSLIQWDPHSYLNVWVVDEIGGGLVQGYGTFPDWLAGSPERDGIVVAKAIFGRSPVFPFILGRIVSHEVGHWLGLYHTFQYGCAGTDSSNCSSLGDLVCDTPPAANPNFGCNNVINSCTETPVDRPDLTQNYMDYTPDNCRVMFSKGQADRMHFYLDGIRSNLHSPSNLAATGADGTVSPGCAPTAQFSSQLSNICVGGAVQFEDISHGVPTSWDWTFQGGNPSTSTQQNPIVTYSTPGVYEVSLTVTNSFGNSSTTVSDYMVVSTSSPTPLVESFEGNVLYPADWYGTDGDGLGTWRLTTAGASLGIYSLYTRNFGLSYNGTADDLVSLPIDLTNLGSGELTFDRAYKRFNNFKRDTMQVLLSTDCGETWTKEWEAENQALVTTGGIQVNGPFVPTASQWVKDTIDLAPYLGHSEVRIMFRVIGGGGQDIYLDNVNIDGVVGVAEEVQLGWDLSVASPFRDEIEIRYSLERPVDLRFELLDMQGRKMWGRTFGNQSAGEKCLVVNGPEISGLPAGVYFLRAGSERGSITKKIIRMP